MLFASLKGFVVEPGSVEGTLGRGLIIRNLRVSGPGFTARIPEARARARWLPLLRGRVELTELELVDPIVIVAPVRAKTGPGGPSTAAPPEWTLDIARWSARGATIRIAGAPKPLRELTQVSASGSVKNGIVQVDRASARAGEAALSASGRAALRPLSVSGRARAAAKGFEAAGWASWRPGGGKGWAELWGRGVSGRADFTMGEDRVARGRWEARAGPEALSGWSGSAAGTFAGRAVTGRAQALGRSGRAVASFTGTEDDNTIALTFSSGPVSARAAGHGGFSGGVWEGTFSALEAKVGPGVRATRPFQVSASTQGFSVSGLELTDGRGRARVALARRGKRWTAAKISARDVDARPWAAAGLLPKYASGSFDAEVGLEGAFARVERLEWRLPDGRLEAEGRVPLARGARGHRLHVRAFAVGLSSYVHPGKDVVVEDPRLDADVDLRFSSSGWLVGGEASVTAKRLAHEAAGIAYERPRVVFAGEGSSLVVRAGTLPISGRLTAAGPKLTFKEDKLAFSFRDGAKGSASVEARVGGTWKAPRVDGDVYVRGAEYKPPKKKKAAEPSKPGAPPSKAPARQTTPIAYDVRVHADRDLRFKDKQTVIELKGDVRAKGRAGEEPEVTGSVETVRGQVSYFGRLFQVTRARALFSGESPPDPALDAEAEWIDPRTKTRVHMIVTGTGKEPRLELTSEPPMDQRDILSFLAFGTPLYEAGEKRGGEQAASLVADYLAQGIGQYLPVDLFNVKLTENQKADVSVGRYLTKDLFITYGQTFEQRGEKRVTADYRVNDQWSLETQSFGEGRYVIDLLFNYGIK